MHRAMCGMSSQRCASSKTSTHDLRQNADAPTRSTFVSTHSQLLYINTATVCTKYTLHTLTLSTVASAVPRALVCRLVPATLINAHLHIPQWHDPRNTTQQYSTDAHPHPLAPPVLAQLTHPPESTATALQRLFPCSPARSPHTRSGPRTCSRSTAPTAWPRESAKRRRGRSSTRM